MYTPVFQSNKLPLTAPIQLSDCGVGEADHNWNGCDAHNANQYYRAKIELGVRPFPSRTVHLEWRREKADIPLSIGTYELNLERLVLEGLARCEHEGRFVAIIVHDSGSHELVVRLNKGAPLILLGWLSYIRTPG